MASRACCLGACAASAVALVVACARPRARPPAPAETIVLPATEPAKPAPEGLGEPWAPLSEWAGRGIPPKQFSLFDVPAGSRVLAYAALDSDDCEAELDARQVAFAPAEVTPGVVAPIRLMGPLHAVAFHSDVPEADRARSRKELIDCRLALALDDFATSLAARGIVDVRWESAYRPEADLGCTRKYRGEQHCAALAVDVVSFGKRDGSRLVVERDFHGKIGTLTCGTHQPPRNELWDIACDAAGRYFQVVLTPNWNADHRNHFHLELTVRDWVLAR